MSNKLSILKLMQHFQNEIKKTRQNKKETNTLHTKQTNILSDFYTKQ
jgi:hypothetical protein